MRSTTYSTFARGIDLLNTTYNLLDLTAKGGTRIRSPPSHGCVTTIGMRSRTPSKRSGARRAAVGKRVRRAPR
ncbi:MAG: hypothetical protein U1F11_13280 [Steroidobacteraceae bacterium]